MRRENTHFKMAGPQERADDQETANQQGGGIKRLEGEVNGMEEQDLAGSVRADGEQQTEAKDHELNAPAHGANRSAKSAFEIHQDHDGTEQEQKMQGLPRPPELEQPLPRRENCDSENQFF